MLTTMMMVGTLSLGSNLGYDRIFMARDGEPIPEAAAVSTIYLASGSQADLTVWLEEYVECVNFYQVALRWYAEPLDDAGGLVQYVDVPARSPVDSVRIDYDHPEYVFEGEDLGPSFYFEQDDGTGGDSVFAMLANLNSLNGCKPVDGVRALGHFQLQASSDATGVHRLSFLRPGEQPTGGTSIGCISITCGPIEIYQDLLVVVTQCGDGVAEGHETCDDGNTLDGDGCTSCRIDPVLSHAVPPTGAIDARQPSNPDGSDVAGWDRVQLVFEGDTSALTAEHFSVQSSGDAATPGIVDVTIDGADVELVFDQRIPLGECTTVDYLLGGDSVRLAHLPGDVDGNGIAAALDILTLIDGLNGMVDLAPWQCDINRSGVCAPQDVLRLIDLLNGAGDYDPWISRSLPKCP